MIARGERNLKQSIAEEEKRLRDEHGALLSEIGTVRADLDMRKAALDALIADRVSGFELIANAWADYEEALAESEASALEVKNGGPLGDQ